MSPRWRRGARAVLLGLLQPGAAEAVERERLLSTRVRARRREPRVVAFVAGKGGVGTTTVAAGVALTLAALRHDETTLVDPRYGTPSLGQRVTGQPAPTVAQFASGTHAARTRGRLGVVDPAPWRAPIWHGDLMRALDQLREANAFTIVDLGTDVSENGTAVLGRADHTIVVTAPTPDAIEATRLALLRVRHIEPSRYGALMVAVVCLNTRQYRSVRQLLKQVANALGIPAERAMAVPFDAVLATGAEIAPEALHPATREAFLYLAGIIAEGAGVNTPPPASAVSRPILVGGRR
jgi:MinD-like ATPase involved in chromosome partitioning or flagellar assembly